MKPGESLISPMNTTVSPGYFEAMKIPLVRGRYFSASDTARAVPKAIIVDDRLAAKFWPGQDPIGRRMYRPENPKDLLAIGPDTKFVTVVGVVKNVQTWDPGEATPMVGAYYYPLTQAPERSMEIVARSTRESDAITNDVRAAIRELDPELAVYGVQTMTERMDSGLIGRRLPMLIAIAFGIVALFLAAIGIYGVLAYGVTQRRREIGIRLALGGTAGRVFRLVVTEGAKIVGVGLAVGAAGAWFAGRAMSSMLYEVKPGDPLVLGGVVAALAIVAFLATIVPARRAAAVNPAEALE
jgi:predicted permease